MPCFTRSAFTRSAPWSLAALCLIVLSCGFSGVPFGPVPALAGEAPLSAWSRSLGRSPLLMDHPSLLFDLPATAPCFGPQILALDVGDYYSRRPALGALVGAGRFRFFLLSQSDTDASGHSSSSSVGLQAGTSLEAGALRFGLAARGSLFRYQEGSDYQVWDWQADEAWLGESREHTVEGVLGIGFGRGARRLDLQGELLWRNVDDGVGSSDQRLDGEAEETAAVFLHHSEKPTPGALVRAVLPLSRNVDLLSFARLSARRQDWRGALYYYDTSPEAYVDTTARFEDYQDRWSAGAAVACSLATLDELAVSAQYESRRTPFYWNTGSNPTVQQRWETFRDGFLVLSGARRLPAGFRAQAGLAAVYRFGRVESTTFQPVTSLRTNRERREMITNEFSWGLSWTRGKLHVTGAMTSPLRLDGPFVAMDFRYLL